MEHEIILPEAEESTRYKALMSARLKLRELAESVNESIGYSTSMEVNVRNLFAASLRAERIARRIVDEIAFANSQPV